MIPRETLLTPERVHMFLPSIHSHMWGPLPFFSSSVSRRFCLTRNSVSPATTDFDTAAVSELSLSGIWGSSLAGREENDRTIFECPSLFFISSERLSTQSWLGDSFLTTARDCKRVFFPSSEAALPYSNCSSLLLPED